jgi:hypothetical protein
VEVLSKTVKSGLAQFVYFNIAYGTEAEKVINLLNTIWQKASEESTAINPEREAEITVVDNGDHAVTWRLGYRVTNFYQLLEAECLIKRIAYDVSVENGIGLQTPLTHEVSMSSVPVDVES